VEVRLTAKANERALATRKTKKKAHNLPTDSPERKKLKQAVDAIYVWLRTAP
jgi:hypothetical protein